MKIPSLSKMFGPIVDPNAIPLPRIEAIRTIRRIGVHDMGDSVSDKWMVVFEGDPSRIILSSGRLEDRDQKAQLTLARPGDRLKTVHVGEKLVAVENLDLE